MINRTGNATEVADPIASRAKNDAQLDYLELFGICWTNTKTVR